ncbi:CoA transferase [Renibacterium salmoninarum]|nr:CoA transferase [Renibacterium salmoninarum]
MTQEHGSKPLAGLRVLEMAAIGPVPHLGTILLNMGAQVTVITRLESGPYDFLHSFYAQGKEHVAVDLKDPTGQAKVLELMRNADVLVEGMRPGVMERLSLGPEQALEANSELIFARVTGYGQGGPLAQDPGHDINYIAQSGALNAFRRGSGKPMPPINVAGDFAGGSMHGVISILAALWGSDQGIPLSKCWILRWWTVQLLC